MPGFSTATGYSESEVLTLRAVRKEIERRIRNGQSAEEFLGGIVRQAIDEILTLGKNRFRLDQLDAPEQTYVGTRSEILLREALDVGAGRRADTQIAGHEVDLKWSKSLNWMIGPENLDTVCFGIGTDSGQRLVSAGLFIPRADRLGAQNRDRKYTAGASFRQTYVDWVVRDAPLPPNFIETLPDELREDVMSRGSAQERIRRLAERLPRTVIPRAALHFVSLHKLDFMRRIREDRSQATPPLGDMVCLSWKYRKAELARLGISLGKDEFVFVRREDVSGPSDENLYLL